jgi:hypothetical protein
LVSRTDANKTFTGRDGLDPAIYGRRLCCCGLPALGDAFK